MDAALIYEKLAAALPGAVSDFTAAGAANRDAFFKVPAARLPEVARLLRDDPDLRCDFLELVTAVDWPAESRLEVVYHLYSYPHRHLVVLKVSVPRDNPEIPSLVELWPAASWHEREQFDLLGVIFTGHPDLRRLLLPDDWVGYPLRKDWKEPASYRGMSTTRRTALEILPEFDKSNPERIEGARPQPAAKPAAAPAAEPRKE